MLASHILNVHQLQISLFSNLNDREGHGKGKTFPKKTLIISVKAALTDQ
jgi:hypothetical protein